MKTGFRGTFVISWSQTETDGLWSAPVETLRVGATWAWTGEAVRIDGPSSVLPLGEATGMTDLRKRAALSVRRILKRAEIAERRDVSNDVLETPMHEKSFNVTDGRKAWTITIIEARVGRPPLLMFYGDVPPRHVDLWVVSADLEIEKQTSGSDQPGGVICFTPGTKILTETGARRVEELREGERVQTKDNGLQEILWIGRRRITGARLLAMPHYAPVRLRRGALGEEVPDDGLLVSPDHRMILKGAQARALFNSDEVLVTAKDLVNGKTIYVDRSVRHLAYIHLMLPSHQVVFANGVETESFHPASAALGSVLGEEQERLYGQLPELRDNPQNYGEYARRVLSDSEAAILRHDTPGIVRSA
ncbi:Hint domain-containing protein [Marivivens sp. LCG002]|uniref:Hint domain-containing protein n=1 Tax=Marivivens sp. LCG002 TaxID=3051171 RepID=UPI0025564326|nr:Hint domain-containing protein [Marivivens sp. LCG002]WIV50124.1 Hint domain-containing protein [Marivivens sp. LCG002]